MKYIQNIFLVLFFMLSWDSFAIEKYIHINKEEYNLSCDLVRCVCQDSRGYVWIGTEMGLNRFDGVRMRQYKSDDYKLPSDYIFSIAEDHNGNIWFGTSRGVACYEYAKDSFFVPLLHDGSHPEDIVSSLAVNDAGEIWFSPNKEDVLYRYDYLKGVLTSFKVDIERGPKYITFDNDRMVFASGNSIYGFDTKSHQLDTLYQRQSDSNSLYERVRGPFVSKLDNDIIYFATEDVLCELKQSTRKVRTLYRWKKGQLPLSISKAFENESFLISTTTGVYSYNIVTGIVDVLHADEYSIYCHVNDDSSYIVASHDYGIKMFLPELARFIAIKTTDSGVSLNNCGITYMSSDGTNKVWVSTKNIGLLEYDASSESLNRVFKNDLPKSLNVVCYDDGRLWVGCDVGLFVVNLRNGHVSRVANSAVSRLLKTTSGQLLCGDKHSLSVWDDSERLLRPMDGFNLSELVSQRAIAEDKSGILWIPTYGSGLFSYNPHTKNTCQYIIAEENDYAGIPDMVTSVLPLRDGGVLAIGSNAQISHIVNNGEKIIKYDYEVIPSLPDASYLYAAEDAMGRIWLSTNSGLVCMNLNDETAVLYTEKTGLSTNMFVGPSCHLESGQIIFSTEDGLLKFHPQDFIDKNRRVDIVSFKTGDEDFKLSANVNEVDRIELPYNKNSFGFSFASPCSTLSYSLRCKLNGFDDKWRTLGETKEVYFYNVPPGEYVLKIEGHKDVKVVVMPPFWSSSKGISLIVLLSLIACFVVLSIVYRRRERIANERAKEKLINEKLNFLSGFVALEQFVANDKETEFMKKFDEVITNHLSDEGFTVEILAKELAMSHTSLGRYTLSTFGTSPVNYIRTKRLAVASHLLKQGGLSVSDISYKCGFSSPAYFAKCFKDAYGMTPSQYQSSH